MLTKHLEKIKVIQTEDPIEFEKLYNEAIDTYHDNDCKAELQQFNGSHVAYIFYTEITKEFNLVSDEFHAEGIHYLCSQCPLHDPQEDGRKKMVWCKYHDCGVTDLRHEACEMFYKKVKQNEIKPIY